MSLKSISEVSGHGVSRGARRWWSFVHKRRSWRPEAEVGTGAECRKHKVNRVLSLILWLLIINKFKLSLSMSTCNIKDKGFLTLVLFAL